MSFQSPWIVLAAVSGACAAFNGVFAKLTTTELTSSWSSAIATTIGLSATNKPIDFVIRAVCSSSTPPPLRSFHEVENPSPLPGYATDSRFLGSLEKQIFFLLNLAFNALMWALFTAALTRSSSTTRVSIINTSANFVLTALLGLVVFGERLPPMWWVGAGGLVVGNVVIGRREEGEGKRGGEEGTATVAGHRYRDRQAEAEISDGVEMGGKEVRGNIREGDQGASGKDGEGNEGRAGIT